MMKTDEELHAIHVHLRENLKKTFGLKFEICSAIARKIIRLDYHTYDLNQKIDEFFSNDIEEDLITITIDTATPKKVYDEILKKIYNATSLKFQIKDTKKFSKEDHLLLLIDIHFYKHYFELSQEKIKDKLEANEEIVSPFKTIDSKDISYYIAKANNIREIVNYNSSIQ